MYNFLEQTEKKVICCQIKHPIPVIGTLRADFSRFVFSFCREETPFKMALSGFRFKKKLSTFLRLSVTTGMRRIDLKENGLLLTV